MSRDITDTKMFTLIIVLILISGIAVFNTYNTIIQNQKIIDKNKEITDLHYNISRLEDDINDLKDSNEAQLNSNNILQSEFADLEKNYNDLSEKFNLLLGDYNSLNNSFNNLTEDYNFLVSIFNREKIIYRSYVVDYYWEYPENYSKTGFIDFNETLSTYYEFSIKNHSLTMYRESYPKFITPDHPIILEIAKDIDNRYSNDIDKANALLDIVHAIEYKSDVPYPNADEDPKYPVETIIDGTGDCEDLSFLFASLCKAIGFEVLLLKWVSKDNEKEYHLNVGIQLPEISPDTNDLKYKSYGQDIYYICECAGNSVTWDVGIWTSDYYFVRGIEID